TVITVSASYLIEYIVLLRRSAIANLCPYTTLFRSRKGNHGAQPSHRRCSVQSRWPRQSGGRAAVLVQPLQRPQHHRSPQPIPLPDRKSTRLNSSHVKISYAVFCLKKKIIYHNQYQF